MINETAQAIAQTWPAWSASDAYLAMLAAGLSALFASQSAIPSGQIRIAERSPA